MSKYRKGWGLFFSILPPHIDGSDELLDWIGLETNNIKSIHEK